MVTLVLFIGLLSSGLGIAVSSQTTFAAEPDASLSTERETRLPVYKPRDPNVPRARIGGLPRGQSADGPLVVALVPDHVGFTLKSDPSLCWFLSQATSSPLVLTVVEQEGIRPVLETPLAAPAKPGIRCVHLKDHGVRLKEGEQYRWSISLIIDAERRSRDIVSGGMIERMAFNEACALGLPCSWSACEREAINRYAEAGLWYDAVSCLQELLVLGPGDPDLSAALIRLLEQAQVPLPLRCFGDSLPCLQAN